MNTPYLRWILLNLLCVALGTALAAVCIGTAPQPTFLFILAIVWLSNEAWNLAVFAAAIVNVGWQFVKTRKVRKALSNKISTRTSFLLLLVPHALFAILYAANGFWGKGLSEALGLPLSHGLFACTYAAVVLLWILAFRGTVGALSVEGLLTTWLEPELDRMRSEDEIAEEMDRRREDTRKENPANQVPPPIPMDIPADEREGEMSASDSEGAKRGWAPNHPHLQELLPALLYYGRPNLSVTNVLVRQNGNLGLVLAILVVPLLVALTVAFISQLPIAAIVPGVLAVVFGWVARKMLIAPRRWREKLSHAEFAFTETQVFIAEGEELSSFDLDSGLQMLYMEESGDVATILFDHVNKHKNPVMKLLVKFGTVDDTNGASLEPGPLRGFYQIDDAPRVFLKLKELGAKGKKAS